MRRRCCFERLTSPVIGNARSAFMMTSFDGPQRMRSSQFSGSGSLDNCRRIRLIAKSSGIRGGRSVRIGPQRASVATRVAVWGGAH
jgi:hypothetical protein